MRMASGSQGAVLSPTDRIVLDGHPTPVVDGVYQARLAGPAADNALCLAGSSGDWCDAGQAAQGLVIPTVQGAGSLC